RPARRGREVPRLHGGAAAAGAGGHVGRGDDHLARHGHVPLLRPVAPAARGADGPAQPAAAGRGAAEGRRHRPGRPPGAQRPGRPAPPLPAPRRPVTPTSRRTLPPKLDEYLPVAAEVEAFCAAHGLPAATRSKVLVALEELVLNLIDHATGWAA